MQPCLTGWVAVPPPVGDRAFTDAVIWHVHMADGSPVPGGRQRSKLARSLNQEYAGYPEAPARVLFPQMLDVWYSESAREVCQWRSQRLPSGSISTFMRLSP